MHIVAAKAVCFGEALRPDFQVYARQIVDNARVLADELMVRGFKLVAGGTDNHLILANVKESFDLDGGVVESALDTIGLTLNKNAVPDDPLPPFRPSGIRLGTPALTTRGLKQEHMAQLAEWMKQAIDGRDDPATLQALRNEVRDFALQFPLPSD
jgi:glycine hydroxymethyltransferase